ncbi:hypothetical protein [Methylobacterium sp. Leaf85]|uniref:hypothetical protein n=1 Tax=Methylobacterium sp. Leaf85 TaxID=1736241 RepID=UPI0012E78C6F|nr:hypothetical protein [Methylobacterium sp. Leaf85]
MIGIASTAVYLGSENDHSFVQLWDDGLGEWPAPLAEEVRSGPFVPAGFLEGISRDDVAVELRLLTDAIVVDEDGGLVFDADPDYVEAMLSAWLASHPRRARAMQ